MTEQVEEFSKAMEIYRDRSLTYGDTWRESGALGQALRARDKVNRFLAQVSEARRRDLSMDGVNLEDAYDAMNHLAFATRCIIEGNMVGSAVRNSR